MPRLKGEVVGKEGKRKIDDLKTIGKFRIAKVKNMLLRVQLKVNFIQIISSHIFFLSHDPCTGKSHDQDLCNPSFNFR